jgi:uncharacterized protein (DUF488 family)
MDQSTGTEQRPPISLFTIGFSGKTAEKFFQTLEQAGVRRVIDTRLHNVSQLAGFTKRGDLEYFLRAIAAIEYVHDLQLAPSAAMLDDYKHKRIDWPEYERQFLQLMDSRRPDKRLAPAELDRAGLLCSESTAEHCHRRLVAEFLAAHWPDVTVRHL